MENIPDSLNFSTVRPPGIPSRITTIRYNPSTAAQALNLGDIVRFDINSNGFWDPYASYINVDVDFTGGEDNVIYQIDSSAQSFFRYMVIYNRGTEIERIMEYDILAAILIDLNYPIHKRYTHSMEGIGFANFSNMTFGKIEGGIGYRTQKSVLLTNLMLPEAAPWTWNFNDTTPVMHTMTPLTPWIDSVPGVVIPSTYGVLSNPAGKPFSLGGGQINTDTFFRIGVAALTESHLYNGSQDAPFVMPGQRLSDYMNTSGARLQLTGFGETFQAPNYVIEPATDYRLTSIQSLSGIDRTFGAGENVGKNFYRQNGFYGIDILYDSDVAGGGTTKQVFNYALSNSCCEPQFTNGKLAWYNTAGGGTPTPGNITLAYNTPGPTWAKAPDEFQYTSPMINGGQFVRAPKSSGSFSFPLLSGLFGVLMPPQSYRLIPMSAFPNITFEFQLSPWAVFTSGFCNTNTNSIMNQPARYYKITRLEFVTCQYVFPADIEAIVMGNYRNNQTLYFHSHSFILGPTNNVPDNQVPGDIQINMGFDSLKALLWCYLPLDYQQWSWCRRQYRLSMNITKIQVKLGMEYYPSLPALSNSGNVQPLPSNVSLMWRRPNNEYVIELYKAFGKYNDLSKDTFISPQNFAVNNRPYAPDNILGMVANVNPDRLGNGYQECFNQYGWPMVHENRCVGKAVFAIDLESLNRDSRVLSGVNTMGIKPFDIIQEYQGDVGVTFKGMSYMYTFMWFDFLIAVNQQGVAVVGRA